VPQGVLARRVVDHERGIAYDRRQVAEMDGVDLVAAAADAQLAKVLRAGLLDDAVDVLAFCLLGFGAGGSLEFVARRHIRCHRYLTSCGCPSCNGRTPVRADTIPSACPPNLYDGCEASKWRMF